MASLPRRAKAKVQTAVSKDEFSFFSELSSASEEDDREDSAWEPQKKVPRSLKRPVPKESKPRKAPRVKKNKPQMSDGLGGMTVKEELDDSVAIDDVVLEDRKNKLDTVQTLKTAKRKQKNPTQSPSAQRTKRLKVDEETNKASNFKSENDSTEIPSTSTMWEVACKKEGDEEDYTCDQFPLKKIKTETCPQGQPVRLLPNSKNTVEDVEMNWDIVQFAVTMSKEYKECWEYFRKDKDKESARCQICSKTLQCKASSTSGLHRHLEYIHGMKRKKKSELNNDEPMPSSSKRRTTILHYVKGLDLEETVSKLAALDGISINTITKSEFIRESFTSKGMQLPGSPSSVMTLIHNYYSKVKQLYIQKLDVFKCDNKKLSISVNEWTSCKNRRYMNVHVYCNETSMNLGLIRIHGNCPAEKVLSLLQERLENFQLKLESDAVAITSDGAAVMEKFGKLSPTIQQFCYNYALHLAVTKVFYVKKLKGEPSVTCSSDSEFNTDSEYEQDGNSDSELIDVARADQYDLRDDLSSAISSVRRIVKIFRYSPVKNALLQQEIARSEKRELEVILDCKTRWNTLERMIERFLKIVNPIKTVLRELKLDHLWKEEYYEILRGMLNCLQPVRLAVEALSNREANILTSEGIFKFLFSNLEKQNSSMSQMLLKEIKFELVKRRNRDLVSLTKYLSNVSCLCEREEDEFFALSSKNEIARLAKSLMGRLFKGTFTAEVPREEIKDVHTESSDIKSESDLKCELTKAISISTSKSSPMHADKIFASLRKEMSLYEATHSLTPNLKMLLDALITIRPTSTDNERNFSTSSIFVTNQRSRLSDRAINALCFLKFHFKNDK
ncbi:S1 RNA binding domain 1 [Rhinolophus ferrumequinum]|uniref:S1 RNA binding domain 1 n=1 Tax=Rhinolophus ferrumequinum TaxID=59479 RepID=A0A7J7V9U0_RHIFE|nr:S1 RNA-binding domain-containing protein 1 isoform X2 [Rhinolophus ferrumequinum]KAF6321781.1 S1 RNA binding domain 1 [Rhinolophus ferrumequinum]